jgi:hypothetical protein
MKNQPLFNSLLKTLSRKIIAMAKTRKVSVKIFSHEQLQRIYFADGQGTKHALAEIIANRFPEELGSRLPPKRKPWVSEYYQMNIFDALALALALRMKNSPKAKEPSANVEGSGTACITPALN